MISDRCTVSNNDSIQNGTELSKSGVIVSNVTAKWTDTQVENALENISLTVRPGRLVAIIGPVGAGKVYRFTIRRVSRVP